MSTLRDQIIELIEIINSAKKYYSDSRGHDRVSNAELADSILPLFNPATNLITLVKMPSNDEFDPTAEKHDYTSTACKHDKHERCRLECKFCNSPCQCPCHGQPTNTSSSGDDWELIETAAEARKDGRKVELGWPGVVNMGRYHEGEWIAINSGKPFRPDPPTHWRRAPVAPEAETNG